MNSLPRNLARFHIDVGDADVGGREKVANFFAAFCLLEHLDRHLRTELGLFVEDDQSTREPIEHRAQGFAIELHSH